MTDNGKRDVPKLSFQNIQKKKPAEDTLVPPLWGTREKKNVRFSRIIFSRCCTCTRRNLRFHVENRQHPDQKQLTRRLAFDLDIGATHRQPASCRARPVNVDDGLEDIRWIRGLGGEKLPAASNALLSNLKKRLFFAIGEGSRFLSPDFYTAAPKYVCVRCLAGARHLSPVVW